MANSLRSRATTGAAFCGLSLAPLVVISLLVFFQPTTALGQGLPPRGYTVMRTKPIVSPPLSPVERLREDIIQSTNPATGTINVTQFKVRTSTLPGASVDQNTVMTQYSTRTSTLPGGSTGRNRVLRQTPVRSSTLP